MKWNAANARAVVEEALEVSSTPERRETLRHFLQLIIDEVGPGLQSLPRGVIHNDANDYNLLVSAGELSGILDFGDMVESALVCELANACAYAMFEKADPLRAARAVIYGYHQARPLADGEIRLLFPLIATRLAMSVSICALQSRDEPEKEYLRVSEASAWKLLSRLRAQSPRLAHYGFRAACGLPPHPRAAAIASSSRLGPASERSPVDAGLREDSRLRFERRLDVDWRPRRRRRRLSTDRGPLLADEAGRGASRRRTLRRSARPLHDRGLPPERGRAAHRPPRDRSLRRGRYRDSVPSRRTGSQLRLQRPAPRLRPHHPPRARYGRRRSLLHALRPPFRRLARGARRAERRFPSARPSRAWATTRSTGTGRRTFTFRSWSTFSTKEGDFPGVAAPSERDLWLSLSPDPSRLLGLPERRAGASRGLGRPSTASRRATCLPI